MVENGKPRHCLAVVLVLQNFRQPRFQVSSLQSSLYGAAMHIRLLGTSSVFTFSSLTQGAVKVGGRERNENKSHSRITFEAAGG